MARPAITRAVHGPVAPTWALLEWMAFDLDTPKSFRALYGGSMPRIADKNADGVAFLFRTEEEAKARERGGGSAFIVGRPLKDSERIFGRTLYLAYLVSNKHVVFGASACVASVNRRDGAPPDVWDIDQNDWYPHPGGDDLVATSAHPHFQSQFHKVSFIQEDKFIGPKEIADYNLGIGDEIFMIGRFYNHQGAAQNKPALRLGTVSMMQEPIWVEEDGRFQDSYAVEMRSKEGFSGSPVALYRKPWTYLAEDLPDDRHMDDYWGLLGVNWGYINDEHGENTWLNGVVPAWKITELLNIPELRAIQTFHEREIQKMPQKRGGVSKSSYVPKPTAEPPQNPTHKADFNRLLGAAVKRPKSSDQT